MFDFSKYKTRDEVREALVKKKGKAPKDFEKWLRANVPLEGYYQTKIMNFLKKEYPEGFAYKAAAGAYSRGGVPDITFIYKSHHFAFEVKRPFLGVVSDLQKQTIQKINDVGGTAAVVIYVDEVREIIKRWEEGHVKGH